MEDDDQAPSSPQQQQGDAELARMSHKRKAIFLA